MNKQESKKKHIEININQQQTNSQQQTNNNQNSGNLTWKIISGVLFALLLLSIFTNGFGTCPKGTETAIGGNTLPPVTGGQAGTFQVAQDAQTCTENGKPIISLYSTTWCPHCQWVGDTFDKVAKEYVAQGKIVAHHWELDTKTDTITGASGDIPASEMAVYQKFNPQGTIPTFVFGCKYYRIGNAYESEGTAGLTKEEAEFRNVINEVIASS